MSLRRAALALTAAAAVLVLAGKAAATIIPQQGIAGAELRMSRPEVRDVLGDPNRVRHGMNDFGPLTRFQYRRLAVTFQGNEEATAITTRRWREKTPKGIGRGSTEAELQDAYSRAKCRREFRHFRHCWLGRFEPGRRVTDFRIRDGKFRASRLPS